MTLVHELPKDQAKVEYQQQYTDAVANNPEIGNHLSKVAYEDLTPLHLLPLLAKMPPSDQEMLKLPPQPERLVVTHVPVSPVCIRPSVQIGDAGTQEDDLSVQTSDIVATNNNIKATLSRGGTLKQVAEQWQWLSAQVALMMNSEATGLAAAAPTTKPIRSICSRLKGKEGRFRGNLSGKRVNFSGRTVISPDPNLEVTEVIIPQYSAMKLTFPEVVCRTNIDMLRDRVIRGTEGHPGAHIIRLKSGGVKNLAFIKKQIREELAADLQYGDVVERHLQDGDVVLFNRQPSLHKMSIMAHRAKVMPWRTFRFNECVCSPYNADFDGDEMNIHLPQTQEARAEALALMGVQNNLITSKNGEPIVAATQDFLTSAWLLTQRDTFLTKDKIANIAMYFGKAAESLELPPPTVMKPVQLWTGKQLISLMLRPSHKSTVLVNLEMPEKNFSHGDPYFCRNDGYVIFYNSELIAGNLGKKILGGSKPGLTFVLIRDNSPAVAAACLGRLSKLSARWLGTRGMSFGIDDVTASPEIEAFKKEQVAEKYAYVDEKIEEYKQGKLPLKPGCDAEQTLEAVINGELGKIRNSVGDRLEKVLPRFNKPRIMAQCGSKGSPINLSQMIVCLGQQNVGGQRIQNGFVNRTLPHFKKFSKTPQSRGFVEDSFFSGLNPFEYFFHTMGGREGLVDTAVKTAETGYMQRKLIKALEDLGLKYDMTVRTSDGTVVQFVFGDDGLNPAMMEGKSKPLNFEHTMNHVQHVVEKHHSNEVALLPSEYRSLTNQLIQQVDQEVKSICPLTSLDTSRFTGDLTEFIGDMATEMEKERAKVGLAVDERSPNDARERTLCDLSCALTEAQLRSFMTTCARKYRRALMEPGEAVGATSAQSIGEPATQMTLKTFHFAGVASMNVTLGVPRIKEIINAAKTISTPIISCKLEQDRVEAAAFMVKSKIQRTVLGDICEYIKQVYEPSGVYLIVKLCGETLRRMQLDLTMDELKEALCAKGALPGGLKIRPECIESRGKLKLAIRPAGAVDSRGRTLPPNPETLWFEVQALRNALPQAPVKGLKQCSRVVVNKEEAKDGTNDTIYSLLVEGYGLQDVMGIEGVVAEKTVSNHVLEVQSVLGIEAARKSIMSEIDVIMKHFGMSVDYRHIQMLGDCMTYRGETLGINRFGISKMSNSTMMLASFEKTSDFLFEAAVFNRPDPVVGVSESIIMGNPVHLGTGLFKLMYDVPKEEINEGMSRRQPLLAAGAGKDNHGAGHKRKRN
ncbi:pre-mRNA-splicing factor syf2 [Perkinsus olseni]|uniref:DNA-directed RNA polymerase subunit n=1 Tax=Perkinsus olseni TaxID=32597 RepID=A0A7J6TUT9_PEROL|nr:pre-mRNA-splicing factor syf2 [Perkinsus olseni]